MILRRKNKTGMLTMLTALMIGVGCNGPANGAGGNDTYPNVDPGVRRAADSYDTDVLIYNGTGTATSDAASVEAILDERGTTYRTVSSDELNNMTEEELKNFGVIVWPGGKAKRMADSLTPEARERIRKAVVEEGVGFVGFCAGAFIAGTYPWNPTWGLEFSSIDFPYYYKNDEGYEATMEKVTFSDGSVRDLVWIGGPHLADFGNPVAKYQDGTVAIAQSWIGKGLMILSGPHPEAPDGWRVAYGLNDSDGADFEYTYELIQAALKQNPVATYAAAKQ